MDKGTRQISISFFLFQKIFWPYPHIAAMSPVVPKQKFESTSTLVASGPPGGPSIWLYLPNETQVSVKKQQKFEFPETDMLQTLFVIRKVLFYAFLFFFFKEKVEMAREWFLGKVINHSLKY